MGYSVFRKIETVVKKFGLSAKRRALFDDIELYTPSTWLVETLNKAKFIPLTNEKTKSERIVSPILVEIAESYQNLVTLFSGERLDVNKDNDLSGECDFFFTFVPESVYLEMPTISLVEAKDEDMEWGTTQGVA